MEIWQISLIVLLVFVNVCFAIVTIGSLLGASFGSPFVPSQKKIIDKMMNIANIKEGEKVFDLGCGDGRIVFEAEKYGADCTGIEVSPPIYFIAKLWKFLAQKKSEIRFQNFFKAKDLFDADVIFLFLLPETMEQFYKKIFPKMKKGSRVISHAFTMKNLQPVEVYTRKETGHAPVYLFVKD